MFRSRAVLLALLVTLVDSTAGRAGMIFTATLTHDQETTLGALTTSTGGPRPLSFGSATFTLNEAETEPAFTDDLQHRRHGRADARQFR
jgi:hypothetical protein